MLCEHPECEAVVVICGPDKPIEFSRRCLLWEKIEARVETGSKVVPIRRPVPRKAAVA